MLAIGAERWKSSGVVRVALVALTDAEREDFIREDIADFADCREQLAAGGPMSIGRLHERTQTWNRACGTNLPWRRRV